MNSEPSTHASSTRHARVHSADAIGTLNEPPLGCWYRVEKSEIVVGAKTGDPTYWMVCAFVFIYSIGFGLALRGLTHAIGWPAIGLSIPFILILAVSLPYCLELTLGHVEIRLSGEQARVFSGVWLLGRTRTLDLSRCVGLTLPPVSGGHRRVPIGGIVLEFADGRSVRIARLLVGSYREFLAEVLRHRLSHAATSHATR